MEGTDSCDLREAGDRRPQLAKSKSRLRGWEAQHVECLTEGGQVIANAMPATDAVDAAVSADIAAGLGSLDAMADEYPGKLPSD
ncbi:hypothetical protein [Microbispora siamensis]|uniref:Uncharacterized protein n=1 Tax=Microbispora siamensis TaxID=564413 RepID=A0ABQ4GZH0_9ACTN|nr:hypothetical protein [Microbispora siamensis]GIH66828.1 hypothetical protein Msi02_76450 [Microbispora siamensis]